MSSRRVTVVFFGILLGTTLSGLDAAIVATAAPTVAVIEFDRLFPSVHDPTVATPVASVSCDPEVRLPPPPEIANVTAFTRYATSGELALAT